MNEKDLLGARADHEPLAVEHGTIGWLGDSDTTYFNRGTQANGNVTFIRVTLHRGRDPNQPLTPDVAQGHQIVARLGTPGMGIPARNGQCVVLFPAGYGEGPGMGVIVSTPGNPRDTMNGAFTRTSDDGKHTRMTTHDGSKDGYSVYDEVTPEGYVLVTPWGKLRIDETGFHYLHKSGARLDIGKVSGLPAPLDAIGSYAQLSAGMTYIEGTLVALGTQTGVGEPTAKATTLYALLGVILATINEIAIYAGTLVPTGATAAEAGVLAGLLLSLNNAIGAAAVTLPSSSTQVT